MIIITAPETYGGDEFLLDVDEDAFHFGFGGGGIERLLEVVPWSAVGENECRVHDSNLLRGNVHRRRLDFPYRREGERDKERERRLCAPFA